MRLVATMLLAGALANHAGAAPMAPLGASYPGWAGEFSRAPERLGKMRGEGFRAVTFIPNYALMGLDRIEFSSAPAKAELAAAVAEALRLGLQVAIKPHLEPGIYSPGFDPLASENHSWRSQCPWRGFFDLDPMTPGYRDGVVGASLEAIAEALKTAPAGSTVRLDLGSELMRSELEFTGRWLELQRHARGRIRALGLEGLVKLSHNFAHHIELPEDMVLRMDARSRRELGRYIAGLDAVALSQYMDLTAAMPTAERGKRLPTAAEVASALVQHERRFVDEVLVGLLGIGPEDVPPLVLGEFGIGRGGLKHPNLWAGEVTDEAKERLEAEIARGIEGLLAYLDLAEGRLSTGAVLWLTGPRYDLFGWGNPADGVAPAAAALRHGLR